MTAAEFDDLSLQVARRVVERERQQGRRSRVVTDAVLEELDHLASQGYTLAEAAMQLGVKPNTLEAALRRRGCGQTRVVDEPAPARRLGSSVEGNCQTGTGTARGIDLPPPPDRAAHDPFAVLEAARERNRIRSPFGEHERPSRYATDVDDDPERFVAPDIDDEEDLAMVEPSEPPRVSECRADTTRSPIPQPAHDPRCGQPLTGGGAPRGWVLMRIVGAGAPRRYCSARCARAALAEVLPSREPRNADRVTPSRNKRRTSIDAADVIRRYRSGQTIPQISRELGQDRKALREIVNAAAAAGQVEKRDDRKTHSGGHPKEYSPELIARVRRLYVAHGLNQMQVAETIGISAKAVRNIMAGAGIEARPAPSTPGHSHPARDGAVGLKQKMRDHGITSADVRAWARQQQMPVTVVGLVSTALVDAYLAAHPTTTRETA